jgi:hypothetical protein
MARQWEGAKQERERQRYSFAPTPLRAGHELGDVHHVAQEKQHLSAVRAGTSDNGLGWRMAAKVATMPKGILELGNTDTQQLSRMADADPLFSQRW